MKLMSNSEMIKHNNKMKRELEEMRKDTEGNINPITDKRKEIWLFGKLRCGERFEKV